MKFLVDPRMDPGFSKGEMTTSTEGASFLAGVWGHASSEIFEHLSL